MGAMSGEFPLPTELLIDIVEVAPCHERVRIDTLMDVIPSQFR